MAKRKNGQGSIALAFDKNGKTKYRMRQQYGYLSNGRPRILTVTGTSESACIKLMHKKIEDMKKYSSNINKEEIKKKTLFDLCSLHLNYDIKLKNKLKPKAADRRESTINNQIRPFPIGKLQAVSIKPQDVVNHIEELINRGYSVSTIVKTLDVINASYGWADEQGYLVDYNPCRSVIGKLKTRLKNMEKRNLSSGVVIVLSETQISQMELYVDNMNQEPLYLYIVALGALLLLYSGMRCGELTALRWKDYSEKTNTITICKTRNVAKNRENGGYIPNENEVKNYHSRTIQLSKRALKIVKEIYRVSPKKDPDDYIIINKVNKPTNPSNYGSSLNKFYRKVGFPDNISGAHILRRTCATEMHNDGCRVEDIAAYLGDIPDTITKYYISLTQRIVADGEVLNVVHLPERPL